MMNVCRVCLATDVKMYHMSERKLTVMYEQVAGFKIDTEDELPKMLCWECVGRLSSAHNFMKKAIKTHLILMDKIKRCRIISMSDIDTIDKTQLKSSLGVTFYKDNYSYVHIVKESDNCYEYSEAEPNYVTQYMISAEKDQIKREYSDGNEEQISEYENNIEADVSIESVEVKFQNTEFKTEMFATSVTENDEEMFEELNHIKVETTEVYKPIKQNWKRKRNEELTRSKEPRVVLEDIMLSVNKHNTQDNSQPAKDNNGTSCQGTVNDNILFKDDNKSSNDMNTNSEKELLDLISSGKRFPIPPGHLQKSCTEESDLESVQQREKIDETIKVQDILQKKLAVKQQKLMEMEKNFTETKENCQNASNLHFDLQGSQVEAESTSMSNNEATIMEKDLNIPKNDPKNTSPKDLAETSSEIGTVSTPPFSHEHDMGKEQEKMIVDDVTENKDFDSDAMKQSERRGHRRKKKEKKSKKNKKRKLDAGVGGDQLLTQVIRTDNQNLLETSLLKNEVPAIQKTSTDLKESTNSAKTEKPRKKRKKDDKKMLETSKVEVLVEVKFLREAMSSLIENFNNFQEYATSKLTAIDENWRQLKNTKTSTQTAPLNPKDIKRPPEVGFTRVDDNMIHLGRGVWLSRATYDNDVYTAGASLAMFVKNIAVSVFGTDYLKKHSVKGKGCNKTKSVPRPAIDSTKALAIRDIYEYYLKTEKNMKGSELQDEVDNYEDYIRQKIADLIRPKRGSKTVGINPNIDGNATSASTSTALAVAKSNSSVRQSTKLSLRDANKTKLPLKDGSSSSSSSSGSGEDSDSSGDSSPTSPGGDTGDDTASDK